ncbi:MAG: hypothetical protein AB7O73_06725 [Bacteroidia bacterium]
MKQLIFSFLAAGLIFASCKKDRTCACTVTKSGTSTTTAALTFSVQFVGNVPVVDTSFTTPINESFSFNREMTKVSKNQAKSNCINYKEPYNETTLNEAPPLQLKTVSTGERKYSCELK